MREIIFAVSIVTLISCSNEKSEAQKTIDNTQHDLDSINKRYARIQKLIDAGATQEEATRIQDSIDKIARIKF